MNLNLPWSEENEVGISLPWPKISRVALRRRSNEVISLGSTSLTPTYSETPLVAGDSEGSSVHTTQNTIR